MAAFSYQHHPFPIESIFLPNTPLKMSSFMEENINTASSFSPFYPVESMQEIPVDPRIHQSSSLDYASKVAFSDDNEPSLTKNQSTESSAVTEKVTPIEKKRKNRNGASMTSAQSKVGNYKSELNHIKIQIIAHVGL